MNLHLSLEMLDTTPIPSMQCLDKASLTSATRVDESSPSSEDSESTWLDGATAVVRNDRDLAR